MKDLYDDNPKDNDDVALIIGRLVLKYINPLAISVSGHIQENKLNGKLILSYTGKVTELIEAHRTVALATEGEERKKEVKNNE
jgi:hypothetical protein